MESIEIFPAYERKRPPHGRFELPTHSERISPPKVLRETHARHASVVPEHSELFPRREAHFRKFDRSDWNTTKAVGRSFWKGKVGKFIVVGGTVFIVGGVALALIL
jgi:hypothetical protein